MASMACAYLREAINNGITLLTPLISSLMGLLIAFLHVMCVALSYGTSACVKFCGLCSPCFHPRVSRFRMANEARLHRRYSPSTHSKLLRQRLAKRKSNVWLVENMQTSDRAASVNTIHDDEEVASLLVEGDNSSKVFSENLINDPASHEHVSAVGWAHDLIIFSDDSKKSDAPYLGDHVYNSPSELIASQPSEELVETNARLAGDASHVSEAGLGSAQEILVHTFACTTTQLFHELQDGVSNLEVSVSKRMISDLDDFEIQEVGVDDVAWKLKQRLSTQCQALDMVHALLERQRMESSVSVQELMAMIAMLQKEKAALVLEAMQQRRMAEEKEMFDENVLINLRDSLVKQEAELLTLEKELELYRRFFFLKDQLATIKKKQEEKGFISEETMTQQHSMLEYPDAKRVIENGQHANLSRELGRLVVNCPIIHLGSPDLRSRPMIVRDTSRVTLKKEASERSSRLQVVEADRELMRHTLELRRKERWELRLLQEVAGVLKSLLASSGSKTTNGLHRACSVSAVEAEMFRSKRARCMEQ